MVFELCVICCCVQIDLVRMHLKRSKGRTDSQDVELGMDMMVVFSRDDERKADSAIIARLANKLELHSVVHLNKETLAVRKLVKESAGKNAESIHQGKNAESIHHVIELLSKFRRSAGLEDINVLEDPIVPNAIKKSPSLVIPDEFLCPITLEIMKDPVFIETGQVIFLILVLANSKKITRKCIAVRRINSVFLVFVIKDV